MKKNYRFIRTALLGLSMASSAQAVTVVTDFAQVASYGTTSGYAPGIDFSGAAPDGSSTTHTYSFDLSTSGIAGGADTLEIVVTGATNLQSGGGNGITADGGGSAYWWEQGEDLSFEVKVKSLGQDVTAYYSVDLTGAALRWSNATSALIAGETISGSGGTSVYMSDLQTGETDETSFTAARQEAGGVCQFSQLRFEVVNTATPPAYVELVADLGTHADIASQGFANGNVPASIPNNSATSHTFVYDLSGASIEGGADSLEVEVTSTNGSNLVGTGFGFSVDGGTSVNWWEIGEDVSFEVRIKKAGRDVTGYYSVDLTGASLRWAAGLTANLAGEAIAGTGGIAINTSELTTGQPDETSFTAERLVGSNVCQFSQLRFVLCNTTPIPDTFVDVVANMGSTFTGGFAGALVAGSYPDNSSPTFNYVYDISGLGLGADTLEVFVTSTNTNNLVNAGGFGITVDAGENGSWWDAGENLDVDVSIKKGDVDVTSYFAVDLTGFTMRWTDRDLDTNVATKVTATVAGESQTPTATGGAGTNTYDLAVGDLAETSFTAERSEANDIAQLAQFKFTIGNIETVPNFTALVANFGTHSTLDSQGFASGYAPAALPSGTGNHTFVYDLSGAGIAGAATLEVEVSSQGSSNIKATGFGFAVEGGNNSWWDAGEDVDLTVRVLDPDDNDITAFYTFDLTGFSTRWVDRDLDADAGTFVTATVAGESFDAPASGPAIKKYELGTGETDESTFSASRTGANDICQFSQIRLIIGSTVSLPDPFEVALGDPPNLLNNGAFTQVTNPSPDDGGPSWPVAGSNSDWFGYYGRSAEVVGWSHFFEAPAGLVEEVGALNAEDADAQYTLDGTDKLSTGVNISSGSITLNSAHNYRNGMQQNDILSGVVIHPSLTYEFVVDARLNAGDPKDQTSTTFTAALTVGINPEDVIDTANAVTGSLIEVLPGDQATLPSAADTAPQSTTISGADLLAARSSGQLNVIFSSTNAELIPDFPNVAPENVNNADNVSQMFVESVSLRIIAPVGDLNADGVVDQTDVDLANGYLSGDGGDSVAVRMQQLLDAGYTQAQALGYLGLDELDLDNDDDFDAADVTLIEGEIVETPVIDAASFDLSSNFDVDASGLNVGTTYYLMRTSDLTAGAVFEEIADIKTAVSETETFSDTAAPADQAFYQLIK